MLHAPCSYMQTQPLQQGARQALSSYPCEPTMESTLTRQKKCPRGWRTPAASDCKLCPRLSCCKHARSHTRTPGLQSRLTAATGQGTELPVGAIKHIHMRQLPSTSHRQQHRCQYNMRNTQQLTIRQNMPLMVRAILPRMRLLHQDTSHE